MFYAAAKNEHYNCFLSEETALPMMHIDDLIEGTVISFFTEGILLTLNDKRFNTWRLMLTN